MAAYGRILFAGCVLMLVAACSVANYQKPISDFAASTASAEKALIALNQQVTQAYADRIRAEVLAEDRIIRTKSGDCGLASNRCQLEAVDASGNVELFDPDPMLGNIVILMRLITAYANGLTEIVNADTADKVATHVNGALGSVENLAKTVDKLGGTSVAKSVTAYKTSVGSAVNWAVGMYVAKVQVDGLRKATEEADPVIRRAASIFEGAAALASDIAKSDLQKGVEASQGKYEDDQEAGRAGALAPNVDALAKKAAAYDRVLLVKPSSVYAKLGEAHAALTDNLHNEEVSFVTVTAKIEAFSAEVKVLVEIVRELAAVETN